MSQIARLTPDLSAPIGDRLDRSRKLRFWFNGKAMEGYLGDTLASALLANGVHFVARSFKYHRPRGITTASAEEYGAILQLDKGQAHALANVLATEVMLYDGLRAETPNVWPSLKWDIASINDRLSAFFIAGFYYKTFKWPASMWHRVYEPAMRRMGGIGEYSALPDPERYDHINEHAEAVIVGGGLSGLLVAYGLARTGKRILLIEQERELGGRLTRDPDFSGWVQDVREAIERTPNIRVLSDTTVFGFYDDDYLCAVERCGPAGQADQEAKERIWHIRSKEIVFCTGAQERPMVFADNDRPGVMLASAVGRYRREFSVRCGERIVYLTNNDSAYHEAAAAAADSTVACIVDTRPAGPGRSAREAARAVSIPIHMGWGVARVHGSRGVRGVTLQALSGDSAHRQYVVCDLLAVSGGWNPSVQLMSQGMHSPVFAPEIQAFIPKIGEKNQYAVGACSGEFDVSRTIDAAMAVSDKVAHRLGATSMTIAGTDLLLERAQNLATEDTTRRIDVRWSLPTDALFGGSRKRFVDFAADVTSKDIALAAQEGYESVEHVKRFTTTGMGIDQGKATNVNALGVLSERLGKSPGAVGTTRFRPPYACVRFGALAGPRIGKLADPVRKTPMHGWHEARAEFEVVGQWLRPWYYPHEGEDLHSAVRRECASVRESVGILDATTLGKIDIQGPDAAEFLNRIYTNGWKGLKVGRCRYGLMCHEDGMVFDDGVTARLGPNHFHMTTTTSNAGPVMNWLEYWLQTQWRDLRVYCTSVTEQWATMAVSGPRAREVVEAVFDGIGVDFGSESFPFMAFKCFHAFGVPVRVFRISFTGELSFEVNVPSYAGLWMWRKIMSAGEPCGITPYGTETMHVLRAEKGFIIVGQETDGTQTPEDLQMAWAVSKKKADFLGRRSMRREDNRRDNRKALVGLVPRGRKSPLPEGAQLTFEPRHKKPVPMLGHVTSSYYSPTLGGPFALAVIEGGLQHLGKTLYAPLEGEIVAAEVVRPVFYDPEGERQNV